LAWGLLKYYPYEKYSPVSFRRIHKNTAQRLFGSNINTRADSHPALKRKIKL
jgi:hypothetical protein